MTWVRSLGWEDPLEEEMATHSSIFVWGIPGTEEPESESESRSVMSDSFRPMDYTVHGILQARILEWVAFHFSRGSSQPRDRTQVSHIAGGFFTR